MPTRYAKGQPLQSNSFWFRAADLLVCALCAILLLRSNALGHDGPEHEIDELTERINTEGPTADLLLQRAVEYQVIRNNAEAVKDLERALTLEPSSPAILRELGRAYFATGKTNEALSTVSRGIESTDPGSERAALLMVRVEILRPRKEHKKALQDAHQAIAEHPSNVEWYLIRSQLQSILKQPSERVKGLEDGIRATGSGVLQIEWVDALIEDNQQAKALAFIENEINTSRLHASWLIRRARVHLATKNPETAKVDLQAALKELNKRLSIATADPALLLDRALAFELLGDKENARKDYQRAKDKGATDEWLPAKIKSLAD